VQINTTQKYCSLLTLIFVNDIIRVIIQEFGDPVLYMNVYNPDKKEITEFSKSQLYFYANSMFLINNIRYIFTILISVTQIDIALFSVLVEQLIVIITIKMLLNEKKFMNNNSLLNKEVIIEMDSLDSKI
jgi:AAA+ ATPase superfamily predicted ATPase